MIYNNNGVTPAPPAPRQLAVTLCNKLRGNLMSNTVIPSYIRWQEIGAIFHTVILYHWTV